jgi:UDP-N-acetylglucosamine acyltransferase
MSIHPTAFVSSQCDLAEDVEIGPHCVLQGRVRLGRGVRLIGHVYLQGPVTIGEGTILYPFSAIGFPPQDFKFSLGDATAGVEIGPGCIIREHVTIHAATSPEAPTRVGERVFMMVNSHVGHDAQVGNNVIMVNNAAIGGHAQLGDGVTLGGAALVHQHTRVGRLAFISGGAGSSMDVPPFCLVPERNRIAGVNLVGLRRAGIPREHIALVRRAFREALRPVLQREEMIEILEKLGRDCPPVQEMAQFVRTARRSIVPGPGRVPRLLASWIHLMRRGKSAPVGVPDDEEWSDA